MTTCSRCDRDAVEHVAYAGQHLCGDHLGAYVERRAKQAVRDQPEVADGTLAVAVSGGKDSLVCLQLLHGIFGVRPDVELVAVTVDEGIEGYRRESVGHARDLASKLGVRHVVKTYEREVDVTMDQLVAGGQIQGTPCATCGVLRRRFLDEAARDVGADWMATGHNLDDVAQSILMNVCRGDAKALARMAPHTGDQPGAVPRILPLRRIPEREVAVYAHLQGLPVQYDRCPHSDRAYRGAFRDFLHRMEQDHPGTRHAILSFLEKARPGLRALDDEEAAECPSCGGISSGGLCRACELVGELAPVEG